MTSEQIDREIKFKEWVIHTTLKELDDLREKKAQLLNAKN